MSDPSSPPSSLDLSPTLNPIPVADVRPERPLQALIDDFKALPSDVLFPVKCWMGDQPYQMRWMQALLFF